MCCTQKSVENLLSEGMSKGVYNTGDVMYDAFIYYGDRIIKPDGLPQNYYLLTCHREENTGDEMLRQIFAALQTLDAPTVYPVHPRNSERTVRIKKEGGFSNVLPIEPVGYLESLYLVKHAKKVVTDSGGLQREAWFYSVPCVTLLDFPPWPETLAGNMNQLCKPQKDDILEKLGKKIDVSMKTDVFGDGRAARKITELIAEFGLETEHAIHRP
jgi:UDP-N-acetylglucosamine 2-epimerase (non-hydrolysing)/UDP-GlcNAc3NAcA epimerase